MIYDSLAWQFVTFTAWLYVCHHTANEGGSLFFCFWSVSRCHICALTCRERRPFICVCFVCRVSAAPRLYPCHGQKHVLQWQVRWLPFVTSVRTKQSRNLLFIHSCVYPPVAGSAPIPISSTSSMDRFALLCWYETKILWLSLARISWISSPPLLVRVDALFNWMGLNEGVILMRWAGKVNG